MPAEPLFMTPLPRACRDSSQHHLHSYLDSPSFSLTNYFFCNLDPTFCRQKKLKNPILLLYFTPPWLLERAQARTRKRPQDRLARPKRLLGNKRPKSEHKRNRKLKSGIRAQNQMLRRKSAILYHLTLRATRRHSSARNEASFSRIRTDESTK